MAPVGKVNILHLKTTRTKQMAQLQHIIQSSGMAETSNGVPSGESHRLAPVGPIARRPWQKSQSSRAATCLIMLRTSKSGYTAVRQTNISLMFNHRQSADVPGKRNRTRATHQHTTCACLPTANRVGSRYRKTVSFPQGWDFLRRALRAGHSMEGLPRGFPQPERRSRPKQSLFEDGSPPPDLEQAQCYHPGNASEPLRMLNRGFLT